MQVCILSDLHLGTFGCHAEEISDYLRSINPEILVLNGDIIDIWQFKKSYFPPQHMQVIRDILKLNTQGTQVYYITGNHDEALRRYSGTQLGNIRLDDKLILELDGKKVWIFHGDVFDATTKGSARLLAQLGGKGYDLLIWLNHNINLLLSLMGREKMSLSITALGELDTNPILRSGAKVGDLVFVSALPGLSAAGLAILGRGLDRPRYVVEAHLNPKLTVPNELIAVANSMCDISDGVTTDGSNIAKASEVDIELSKQLISDAAGFSDLK
ncbi:MAG: hypothetical protein EBQ97_03435, partial [Bacteroidetes bacterium]|nr:hypothetical protein [Bacteroidota bacterium]